jgi:hypothetical protein
MPSYTPPLRDMQFVMHELLDLENELKAMPKHAETDAEHHQCCVGRGRQVCGRSYFSAQPFG